MTTKIVLFYCLILFSIYGVAQIPPSPGSLGVIRETNIPVNLYSGIPQITVPLFNLPHHNGHSIPVALSYHAGGHKVQDVAGSVGLGWNLHGGGLITRVVRGNPDNGTIATPADFTEWANQMGVRGDHPQNQGLDEDTEYDLFYFAIPGRSGKFIVKENGDAYSIPFHDIKIEKTGNFDNAQWTITDEQGNKYFFNSTTNASEKTRYIVSDDDGTYDPNDAVEYVSTWYLTKIDFYNTNADVLYGYLSNKANYSYENYNKVMSVSWNNCNGVSSRSTSEANVKTEIVNPKYLSYILTKQAKIEFDWSDSRTDIGTTYIQGATVYDHLLVQVQKFSFNYEYADSFDARFFINVNYGCQGWPNNNNDRYRLMLKEIRSLQGGDHLYRKFHYWNNTNFVQSPNGCSNDTDLRELPPRNSYHRDHWGFHAYHVAGGDPPDIHDNFPSVYNTQFSYSLVDGHKRFPNLDGSLSNMLYKIEYESGGFTEFEYELNNAIAFADKDEVNPSPENIGGLRIKSIKQNDGAAYINESTYQYNTGIYRHKPIHYFNYFFYSANEYLTYADFTFFNFSECTDISASISSQSFNSLYDLNGVAVEYPKVTVARSGYGKEEFEYFTSYDAGYEDDFPQSTVFAGNAIYPGSSSSDVYLAPYAPYTTNFWRRGLLKKKSYIEAVSGNPRYSEEYLYETEYATGNSVTSQRAIRPSGGVFVQSYTDKANTRPLSKVIRKVYDIADPSHFSVTETGITVSAPSYFATTILTTNADGSQNEVKRRYVNDIAQGAPPSSAQPTAGALWKMKQDNAISGPIEELVLFRESTSGTFKIVSGVLSTFKEQNGLVVPLKTYSIDVSQLMDQSNFSESSLTTNNTIFQFDDDYSLQSEFGYNNSGELTSVAGRDGIEHTFSYNGFGYLTSSDISTDNSRSKSYSYKPLVGVESETDMNNKSDSYEYDDRNRLHLVRDSDNNIVERYRYNYGDEANEINANIDITGIKKINETITFKASDVQMYGPGEYQWLIDGVNKTGETVTHTFSTSGSKSVTLTIVNPEYAAPESFGSSVTIYSSDWTLASITGNDDVCIGDNESYSAFYLVGAHSCETPGNINYSWQYRTLPSGSWQNLSSSESFVVWNVSGPIGNAEIKVTATDDCGTSVTKTKIVDVQFCGFGG